MSIVNLGTLNSDVASKAEIVKHSNLIITNQSLYKLDQNVTSYELKIFISTYF